jgi:hypothetical protein
MNFPKLPKWVSVLSIIATVLAIAGPDISAAIPAWAKYVTLATTLATALARSLGSESIGNTVSNSALRTIAALLLAPVLLATTFTMTACGASELQRVVAKADNVVKTIRTLDPLSQLAADNLISETEAKLLNSRIDIFTDAFSTFDVKLTLLVQSDPKATLASLAPLFAEALMRLNELVTIPFSNPAAQLKLNKILAGVRLGVTFIAAFFVTKLTAAAHFLERERLAMIERAILAYNGVSYDKAKLQRARLILKDGKQDAPARAVCDYLNLRYDRAGLELLQSYASLSPESAS